MLRKRIKKKKPLKLFTKQKLHSKSTYFYTKWLNSLKSRSDNLANDFRWSSRHCEQGSSGFRLRDGANPTRSSREKKSYSKIAHCGSSYILPAFCSIALLLVAGVMINPFAQGEGGGVYAISGRSATINPTLSIEIDNGATMNPTYVTPGEVAYRSHIVKVSATDIMNYTLQLTAASGESTELKNGDASIPGTVAKVGKELAENTWGWSWSETNTDNSEQTYYALPAYGTTGGTIDTGMLESKQANEQNTVEFTKKLTFAANMGSDKPSGHYTTTAMLSLAATPKQLVFDGITTMQEMNSTICENAAVNDTTQLKDIRDEKTYWVTKLEDNNCWMTQNLALDLNINIKLTDILSNVSANGYTPPANTQQGIIADFPSEDNLTFSYNPGEYVYTTPMEQNNCSAIGVAAMDGCPNWELIIGLSKDISGIEQAHYLAGNYYSYEIATASSEVNPAENNVASAGFDICPKGWRLPRGGYNEGELYNIFHRLTASVTDTTDNIKLTPYYFVYSGYVGTSSLSSAGNAGYYWSSTTSRSGSYSLFFLSSDVNMSLPMGAYYGLPVRCVAR